MAAFSPKREVELWILNTASPTVAWILHARSLSEVLQGSAFLLQEIKPYLHQSFLSM